MKRKQLIFCSLPVALCAATPLMAQTSAQTAMGPYLGIEGGVNWETPQDYRGFGQVLDRLSFDRSWAAGLAGGYTFADGLRPELELDVRRNGLAHDTLGDSYSGHDNADSAMANLWYDFHASEGLLAVLHPYLGGGVGGVRSWYGSAAIGGSPLASDYATEFGYQFGAGVAYDITRNFTVSLDYRHLAALRGDFHNVLGGYSPDSVRWRYEADTALLSVRYTFGHSEEPAAAPPPPPAPPPAAPPPAAESAPAPQPLPAAPVSPPCQPPAGFQVDADCHIIDQNLVVRGIDFETNSVRLTAPSRETLDQVAVSLGKQRTVRVEIQGYTDSRGSDAYNQHLSERRAQSVKDYLVMQGVGGDTLDTRGFGKSNPIASNDTAEGRAQNRRVVFVVTHAPDHVHVSTEDATEQSTEAAERNGGNHKATPKQ